MSKKPHYQGTWSGILANIEYIRIMDKDVAIITHNDGKSARAFVIKPDSWLHYNIGTPEVEKLRGEYVELDLVRYRSNSQLYAVRVRALEEASDE